MDRLLRALGTGVLFVILAWLGLLATAPIDEQTSEAVRGSDIVDEVTNDNTRSVPTLERSDVFYQAILDRPVFEITRRPVDPNIETPEPEPVPEPVAEAPEPAPQLPNVSLLGVMSTGSRIQALISVDGGDLLWLSEGEKIGGWTITGAGEDWLELAADNNKVRLELFE